MKSREAWKTFRALWMDPVQLCAFVVHSSRQARPARNNQLEPLAVCGGAGPAVDSMDNMADDARAWMQIVPYCPAQPSARTPHAAGAVTALRPEHRREVASLVASGVASAAFFLAPLVPVGTPASRLPSTPIVIRMAAMPVVPVLWGGPPESIEPAQRMSQPIEARLPFTGAAAPEPPLAPVESIAEGEEEEVDRATADPLGRVVPGGGRSGVQPFPTLENRLENRE